MFKIKKLSFNMTLTLDKPQVKTKVKTKISYKVFTSIIWISAESAIAQKICN